MFVFRTIKKLKYDAKFYLLEMVTPAITFPSLLLEMMNMCQYYTQH
jgi:hypothetical protein